jgi:hypothetical protein
MGSDCAPHAVPYAPRGQGRFSVGQSRRAMEDGVRKLSAELGMPADLLITPLRKRR